MKCARSTRWSKCRPLVSDDGQLLVDSTLIIDYLESLVDDSGLMPTDKAQYATALGIIGAAMVANEKTVQLFYETGQRPEDAQHEPWIARLRQQLTAALGILEETVGDGSGWLFDNRVGQADITVAVAWGFVQIMFPDDFPASDYPGLQAFSARAESLPQFQACPAG